MSPPVQQRRLKWSDFNERTAVPNPTAPAALLGFFEVGFTKDAPGDWSMRRLISSAVRHTGHAGRASLPTNRSTVPRVSSF